jgi:hypothetical protein
VADPKTNSTDADVKAFLAAVTDPGRKADCQAVIRLMKGVTQAEPVLWGASVIGFGTFTTTTASGRTNGTYLLGVSPRKKDLSVYITPGLSGCGDLLAKLGTHKLGKTCVYVSALADVDAKVLKELLTRAVRLAKG